MDTSKLWDRYLSIKAELDIFHLENAELFQRMNAIQERLAVAWDEYDAARNQNNLEAHGAKVIQMPIVGEPLDAHAGIYIPADSTDGDIDY